MQITYLIVADTLVATVITILQLLQHIVSLKLGAFIANCRLVTISKPRYSVYPTQIARRLPVRLDVDAPVSTAATEDAPTGGDATPGNATPAEDATPAAKEEAPKAEAATAAEEEAPKPKAEDAAADDKARPSVATDQGKIISITFAASRTVYEKFDVKQSNDLEI